MSSVLADSFVPPATWQSTRLSRVVRIIEGLVDPTTSEWSDWNLLAPNHIEKHTGRVLAWETAMDQGADSGKGVAFPGQVVYSKIRPALNKVALVDKPCLISADMYALAPSSQITAEFLWYWLRAQPFLDFVTLTSMRVKMPKVNREEVGAGPVLVPPFAAQEAITSYLDRETAQIDTLICEQEKLLSLLLERRVSLIEGSVAVAEAGGRIDKLSRHTRIGNGSTPRRETAAYWADGTCPWLNSSVVNQPAVSGSDQFVTDTALGECHLPIVPAGSVLVGLTGQGRTRGMATVLEIEATINQHLAYVTPEPGAWDSRFLLWTLRAKYGYLRRVSEENGSTKGGLTCQQLKELRVARPSLPQQRALAAELDSAVQAIDTMVREAERLIELARERRAALITAAVTGQIEIPGVN